MQNSLALLVGPTPKLSWVPITVGLAHGICYRIAPLLLLNAPHVQGIPKLAGNPITINANQFLNAFEQFIRVRRLLRKALCLFSTKFNSSTHRKAHPFARYVNTLHVHIRPEQAQRIILSNISLHAFKTLPNCQTT